MSTSGRRAVARGRPARRWRRDRPGRPHARRVLGPLTAAALEIYEQYRRRLRDRGAVPGPALRAAHEAVLAAESPVRRGLEPEPEHFLGREADVTGVLKALSTRRLVTLTGPGGVGKTTLAQVVAARSRRPAVYASPSPRYHPGPI